MSISPQFKDELRRRLRLSDIIGKRVSVQRAGNEFKACCPFHNEKTPSFTINDQKMFYHCFGCGAHGDVITFVMEHDNLPFMEALEMLAAQAGMEVPKPTPEQAQAYKKQDRLMAVMQEATRWFREQLKQNANRDILNYVLKRGLSEDTIERFRIGYAPEDRSALIKAMREKGFTDQEMIETSLIKPAKDGRGEPYAFFRERVMFPVSDSRGRVVAFGGRILPDEMRKPSMGDFTPPKYMNSADTPLFHKGRMVYNEAMSRAAAGKGEPVIVTEGYMDVIALVQAGFEGAVAPLGTALTEDQIKLCWSMIPDDICEPVICFDGDMAGLRAASRAVERMLPMLEPGKSARFAFMPEGEDPDSLIKEKGVQAFRDRMEAAQPLVNVIWRDLTEGKSFDTPERMAALDKAIGGIAVKISDQGVAFHYKNKLREKMRETFGWKKSIFKKRGQNNTQAFDLVLETPSARQIRLTVLFRALALYPDLIGEFEEDVFSLDIDTPELKSCRDALWAHYVDGEELALHLSPSLQKKVEDHSGFLNLEDQDRDIVREAVKQLLKNLRQHGRYSALGKAARLLDEN